MAKTAHKTKPEPRPAEAEPDDHSAGVSVRIDDLAVHFGAVRAVDGVTLDVRRGELFFLLGPSGCGKTTLLRTIAGFVQPTRGTVAFDGRRIDPLPPNERNTGMVFQNYALWPHLSVAQNVSYGLEVRKRPPEQIERRVQEMLTTVGLAGFGGRRPAELSGGQQQRVALARALIIEPEVVLLDEPLSNLDANLRSAMRREILQIQRHSGVTTLYVTHDQREGLSMADHIAIMHQGRIMQVGTPGEVYRYPASEFVATFLGEANRFFGKLVMASEAGLVVDSPLGRIELPAEAGVGLTLTSGARLPLFVRPEAVRLGATRRRGAIKFKAALGESTFQGENARFVLVVKGKSEKAIPLSSLQYNPRGVLLEVGREVDAFIEMEDVGIIGAKPPDAAVEEGSQPGDDADA